MDVLEALSQKLLPYKEHVALAATVITIAQLLSPILLLNDIRKAKSSAGFTIIPFLGGGILSVLFVQFGQMLGDATTVKVNLIGFGLSMAYIFVFYYYTPVSEKFAVWGKVGIAGAFVAALISYTMYEDPAVVEQRFGLILTGILYLLIASPMIELKQVFRDKSTASLPFPLIFMGFAVSMAWLVYGIILNSIFMVGQNLFAVLLTGFQLSFFLIYPSTPRVKDAKKKKN